MFRALCAHHQEVKIVLYTASGIVTPVGGRPVHRLREDGSPLSTCAPVETELQSSPNVCTGRPHTGVMIPDAV